MERACQATSRECLRAQLLVMVGEQPGHGYDLCDRLGCVAAGVGAADTVAVYRALRAMEKEGLVESAWDEPTSGPARRVYSLACS
jgi:PadR family transcriptional regulator PadR